MENTREKQHESPTERGDRDGENQAGEAESNESIRRRRRRATAKRGTTRLTDPSFNVIDGKANCGRKE